MIRSIVACAVMTCALTAAAFGEETWHADLVHSRAEFTVSHLMVSNVSGHIPLRALTLVVPAGAAIPTKLDALLDVAELG